MSHCETTLKDFQLQSIIIHLEAELKECKRENHYLKSKEVMVQGLEKEVKDQSVNIEFLEKKLKEMDINYKNEISDLEKKKDSEIFHLSNQIKKINQKYEMAIKYESYLDSLEKLNNDLTKKVTKLENDVKKEKEIAREQYIMKLDKVKQKTLDVLANIKKESQLNALENNSKSVKIQMLYNKELFLEVTDLAKQIEELLFKLDEKENIIRQLKIELTIQKEVDKIITKQKLQLKKGSYQSLDKNPLVNQSPQIKRDKGIIPELEIEKERGKLILFSKRNDSKSSQIVDPAVTSSRNRNISTGEAGTEMAFHSTNSIMNIKITNPELKKMAKTGTDFLKTCREEKSNEESNGLIKKKLRTFHIVEKEECITNDKIKFLNNYNWYFDLIQKFFNDLKVNHIKLEDLFEQEKLDSQKINVIIKFIKQLHNEIKNKILELNLENKTKILLSKSKDKKSKNRSKSILDEFIMNRHTIQKSLISR